MLGRVRLRLIAQMPLSREIGAIAILFEVFGNRWSFLAEEILVSGSKEFYFGPLPVKLRGVQDLQTGSLTTRTVTTDIIDFYKIHTGQDKNWKRIDDPDQLAVLKPMMTLVYFDGYSEADEPEKL